jgi:hypothetical protein
MGVRRRAGRAQRSRRSPVQDFAAVGCAVFGRDLAAALGYTPSRLTCSPPAMSATSKCEPWLRCVALLAEHFPSDQRLRVTSGLPATSETTPGWWRWGSKARRSCTRQPAGPPSLPTLRDGIGHYLAERRRRRARPPASRYTPDCERRRLAHPCDCPHDDRRRDRADRDRYRCRPADVRWPAIKNGGSGVPSAPGICQRRISPVATVATTSCGSQRRRGSAVARSVSRRVHHRRVLGWRHAPSSPRTPQASVAVGPAVLSAFLTDVTDL